MGIHIHRIRMNITINRDMNIHADIIIHGILCMLYTPYCTYTHVYVNVYVLCICIYIYAHVNVYVYVSVTHMHYTYAYIYNYMPRAYVSVYVCVCLRFGVLARSLDPHPSLRTQFL